MTQATDEAARTTRRSARFCAWVRAWRAGFIPYDDVISEIEATEDHLLKQVGAEGLSVRLELQADCFAGIWAHATNHRGLLESGDLDEALTAAAAIGDDRLQKMGTGRVQPESWTHGSSEQRSRWFRRGFESGAVDACDTFAPGAI